MNCARRAKPDRIFGPPGMYREAGSNTSRLREHVAARDSLNLVIADGGSLPLAASVESLSEWTPAEVVAHVAVCDERYWLLQPRH
jgi:hypothetical protein